MEGGKHEAHLTLEFTSNRELPEGGTVWTTEADFHDADIQVDAIIGYPWLEANQLGVFPHLRALALMASEVILLRGEQNLTTTAVANPKEEEPEEDDTEDLEPLRWLDRVRGMRLTLPCEIGEGGETPLLEDEDTQLEIAKALRKSANANPQLNARGTIVVPEGEHVEGTAVEALRAAIRADY
jgi:hypothetical protein